MSTLADYRAGVRARGYDGLTDTLLNTLIQDARKEVFSKRRWTYREAQSTALSTTLGSSVVSLTSITDLGAIEGVRYRLDTIEYDLNWKELQDFRDWQALDATTAQGMPAYWTRRSNDLLLTPTPDRAYVLAIDYVRAPTDLPDDSTQDTIPDADRELVVYYVIVNLAARQREAWLMNYATDRVTTLLRMALDRDTKQSRSESDQVKPYWKSSYRWGR